MLIIMGGLSNKNHAKQINYLKKYFSFYVLFKFVDIHHDKKNWI